METGIGTDLRACEQLPSNLANLGCTTVAYHSAVIAFVESNSGDLTVLGDKRDERLDNARACTMTCLSDYRNKHARLRNARQSGGQSRAVLDWKQQWVTSLQEPNDEEEDE